MKPIYKLCAVLLACAALFTLGSCKQHDDDDDDDTMTMLLVWKYLQDQNSVSTVATYMDTDDTSYTSAYYIFYNNKTGKYIAQNRRTTNIMTERRFTYTGDPTRNGTVNITYDAGNTETLTISNSSFSWPNGLTFSRIR